MRSRQSSRCSSRAKASPSSPTVWSRYEARSASLVASMHRWSAKEREQRLLSGDVGTCGLRKALASSSISGGRRRKITPGGRVPGLARRRPRPRPRPFPPLRRRHHLLARGRGGEAAPSDRGGCGLAGRDGLRALVGDEEMVTSSEEIAWAFRKLLETVAFEQPLVCVLDDLQWGGLPRPGRRRRPLP